MPIQARNIRVTLIIKFIFNAYWEELPGTDDSHSILPLRKLEKRKKNQLISFMTEHCLSDTALLNVSGLKR